jgi:hypothetical protein
VIHTSYDQECHIFAPTCFPPLVTIYRKVIEWRIQNGTAIHVCRACVVCVVPLLTLHAQVKRKHRTGRESRPRTQPRPGQTTMACDHHTNRSLPPYPGALHWLVARSRVSCRVWCVRCG